jgi:hypothetical protein
MDLLVHWSDEREIQAGKRTGPGSLDVFLTWKARSLLRGITSMQKGYHTMLALSNCDGVIKRNFFVS